MSTFIGVDLGWYGKPSGLASIALDGAGLRLRNIARLEAVDDILGWIQSEAGSDHGVVAVDAPLIIRNQTGIRPAERELNRDFRRFHAGCHAANLGRPFARNVVSFSGRLEALGFRHGASIAPRQEGRFQVEVHRPCGDGQPVRAGPDCEVQARHAAAKSAGASPSSKPGPHPFAGARSRTGVATSARAEIRQHQTRRRPDRRGALRVYRRVLVAWRRGGKQAVRQRGDGVYRGAAAGRCQVTVTERRPPCTRRLAADGRAEVA